MPVVSGRWCGSLRGREALYALFSDLVAQHPQELLELANVDVVYEGLDQNVLLDARKALDDSV